MLREPVVAPIRQPIDGEVPERSIGAVSKCVDSRPGASHLIPVSPVFCGLWLAGKSSRATQSRRVLWRPVPIWVPIPTRGRSWGSNCQGAGTRCHSLARLRGPEDRRCRALTYLSIISKLEACEAVEGVLVEYHPTIPAAWGHTPRRLWLLKAWYSWCFPDGDHPDSRILLTALAQVENQLNAFVRGRWMESQVDLTQLCPRSVEAWEIRTYIDQPYVRLFGWFPAPLVYVVAHCKLRDDLERTKGPNWDAAIRLVGILRDQLLPGLAPFRGNSFTDYLGYGGESD